MWGDCILFISSSLLTLHPIFFSLFLATSLHSLNFSYLPAFMPPFFSIFTPYSLPFTFSLPFFLQSLLPSFLPSFFPTFLPSPLIFPSFLPLIFACFLPTFLSSRSSFCLFLSSPLIFLHIVIFSSLDFESIDSLWGCISSCWPNGWREKSYRNWISIRWTSDKWYLY